MWYFNKLILGISFISSSMAMAMEYDSSIPLEFKGSTSEKTCEVIGPPDVDLGKVRIKDVIEAKDEGINSEEFNFTFNDCPASFKNAVVTFSNYTLYDTNNPYIIKPTNLGEDNAGAGVGFQLRNVMDQNKKVDLSDAVKGKSIVDLGTYKIVYTFSVGMVAVNTTDISLIKPGLIKGSVQYNIIYQ